MSTDPVFSEVQKINPSAIIELFVLELNTALHGNNPGLPDSSETNVYRFHAGSNLNANGRIIFANKTYSKALVSNPKKQEQVIHYKKKLDKYFFGKK